MLDVQVTWQSWRTETIRTIESLEIIAEPFPHFIIEPFFPEELFGQLERFWPADHCFWGQSDIAEGSIAHREANLRKVVIIDDAEGFSDDEDAASFWKNFRELIRGPELTKALLERCFEHIVKERKDLNLSEVGYWQNLLLEVDTEGFQIGPHTDSAKSIISLLLYIPYPESPEEYGTSIFKPTKQFLQQYPHIGREFDTGYHAFDDFEEIFRAPYHRNCLFGIVNCPRAFHGLFELKELEKGRRNILWSITDRKVESYPSALERVKQGITQEAVRTQKRLDDMLEAKNLSE